MPPTTPDGTSDGNSTEPTVEQLQQQVAERQKTIEQLESENTSFKERVEKGELVSPTDAISAAIKAGEVFSKDRYVGLQKTYQTEQEARKKADEDLGLLKTQVVGFETDKSTLSGEVEQLKTTVTEKDSEITALQKKQQRASLIFSQFPELASFEADGLLPDAKDEEGLTTKFKAFSEKLGTMKQQGAKEFASGGGTSTPSSKGDAGKGTADTFLKLANEAVLKGDIDTYNENFDKYLNSLKEQENS
jgi:hypothetical protein